MGKFTVYKSSAGSGKTFTLVKEYLILALADKQRLSSQYRSILAITFTNKAAAEMKWRIIKALRELSENSESELNKMICGELHLNSGELRQRAGIVLSEILHHYSDFSIGTIDSFTHRIIRSFALDLKLPVNFQVETDVNYVFNKIISLLLNELGRDKALTDYLVHYSLSQAEENKNWNPEQGLLSFINDIYKEGKTDILDALKGYSLADFDMLKRSIAGDIKQHEQTLAALGNKALLLLKQHHIDAEDLYQGSKGISSFFKKLTLGEKLSLDELYNTIVKKILDEDKWHGGKTSPDKKLAIDTVKGELIALARQAIRYVEEHDSRYNLLKLIYKNIYAMGLVNELAKLTTQFKEEENILFISEFNERISQVVTQEPTPFIYERLGERYQHFLLDEFQDTSVLQWQNILPLLDNALSNGKFNLIVGDGKQSIYRWRNANVEQFNMLPNLKQASENPILQEREQILLRNFDGKQLNKNYRSRSEVIEFNNDLFGYLSDTWLHDELKSIYHGQAQEHKHDALGYVTMDLADIGDGDKDQENCRLVADYIAQAKSSGYNYSDICIIVRKNGDGNTIANDLIKHGIPVVSSESLLLNNALEVNVLVSFLTYVSNEQDLVAASVVLNYLHQKNRMTETDYIRHLKELNLSKTKNLYGILGGYGIDLSAEPLQLRNLYDICTEVSQALQLHLHNPTYVRFFLDEILSFLASNTSNIRLFLEWWERKTDKSSVVIPEGMNAVSIMTIHKSKGLEFPVVITPYITWDTQKTEQIWVRLDEENLDLPVAMIDTSKAAENTKYSLLAEKEKQLQLLDSLNLLYVDFTRAIDRLHIISLKSKGLGSNSVHHWLSQYAGNKADFNNDTKHLAFGNPGAKEAGQHRKQHEELLIEGLHFNTGEAQGVVEIKGGSNYYVNEELEKAREYGVLVHYILSQVNTHNDVHNAIHKALMSGDLNEDEARKIETDVSRLINQPELKPYFSEEYAIKNETEILTSKGDILRPDRIVVKENAAVVIDYKTGKKNASAYHLQMKHYEQALRELGFDNIRKYLVYIHEQQVEEVL
ncbi:MAG: UvrD-helicase domain-containing protein [Bacteroidetes bacterium]|nr:UvrD-helicase domain-containing protein [Bacteroidota bacterium]